MKKSTSNRLAALEARLSPRKKVAVLLKHKGETEKEAYARHYEEHSEDKGAELTVILVRVV